MRVPFSYLDRQFADIDIYLEKIKEFVLTGDFTLGKELEKFEKTFSSFCQTSQGIGVGSGTDAITLPLKMLGIKEGDEVITTPMTFIATVGGIVMSGATPVFVDSEDGFVIDPDKIEEKITERTKAIVPVHYTGNVANMPKIMAIAEKYNLKVVEDACQAIGASIDGKKVGSWGDAGAFSFHPLKNINVWSDAGMIVTNDSTLAEKLRLFRNHGLVNRDEVSMFGCNSRMDTIQAVIANHLFPEIEWITQRKIQIANRYDEAFEKINGVTPPIRRKGVKHSFHLYLMRAEKRDELLSFLQKNGIGAKIHYPIPVHLQEAATYLGYKEGDFPKCEEDCKKIITLPVHQHLTDEEVEYVIEMVSTFYANKGIAQLTGAVS